MPGWPNYLSNSVNEVTAAGTIANASIKTGGVAYPAGMAIDGAQDVWVANYRGQSISKLAGTSNTAAVGTALSPSTGYGRDANLLLPFSVGIDFSGDVWVSNYSPGNLVEFIGLAAPTATPASATPATP